MMVAVLQSTIKNQRNGKRTINIPCAETLDELGCYEQTLAQGGQSYRFSGTTGMHDDRVMSLVLGVYAAKSFPIYDYDKSLRAKRLESMKTLPADQREVWEAVHKEDKRRESERPIEDW
jgi:hypothetical protein